jgi:hypothetical protein
MRGRVGPGLLASYQGRVFAQVLDLFEKGRPPDGGDGEEPHLLEDPATTEPRKARLVSAAVVSVLDAPTPLSFDREPHAAAWAIVLATLFIPLWLPSCR